MLPSIQRLHAANPAALLTLTSVVALAACDDPVRPDARQHVPPASFAEVSLATMTPQDLGTFGGAHSNAQDVNALGQVVGAASVPSTSGTFVYRAFVWDPQTKTKKMLVPDDGGSSSAHAINDAGQAVGYRDVTIETNAEAPHAMLWDNGVPVDLTPQASGTAWDIDNLSRVVGVADIGGGIEHAVRWTRGGDGKWGAPEDLDLDDAGTSVAYAANDAGQIVGAYRNNDDFKTTAALWTQDGQGKWIRTDLLPTNDYPESMAFGINENRDVVGVCRDPNTAKSRACFWAAGGTVATDLGELPNSLTGRSEAWDINDNGDIVGTGVDANGRLRGILWSGGSIIPLDPIADGEAHAHAYALNEAGVIAGESTADTGTGASHASVWTVAESKQPYPFSGFLQPVDNPGTGPSPVVNKAKAGSAIPVKFTLGGDQGLAIFEPGYPKVVACDAGTPQSVVDQIEQTVVASSSTLKYDAATGVYTFVWKTEKSFANSCRKLLLGLNDGSSHYALFGFSR